MKTLVEFLQENGVQPDPTADLNLQGLGLNQEGVTMLDIGTIQNDEDDTARNVLQQKPSISNEDLAKGQIQKQEDIIAKLKAQGKDQVAKRQEKKLQKLKQELIMNQNKK